MGFVLTAIFGILNGGLQMGQTSQFSEALNTAKVAAVTIYKVIDRVSPIDSESSEGEKRMKCA